MRHILILFFLAVTIHAAEFDWDTMLEAMATHESEINDSAYNKKEKATGRYQIRPIYLKEVNIYYGTSYKLKDMKNPVIARWVVVSYAKRWKSTTLEQVVRRHNGGPRGYTKRSTIRYYLEVLFIYERLTRERRKTKPNIDKWMSKKFQQHAKAD